MTICAKCGTENAAGDAFCGSCGAFLEFAAEEAAETAGGIPSVSPDAPLPTAQDDGQLAAPSAPAGASTGPATPLAPLAGTAIPAAASGAPEATGPTCTACGRANPAGRRFCISCGERLPSGPAATAAAAGGAADVAAAPTPAAAHGGPPGPTWEFPTAPIPAPAPEPAGAGAGTEAGGGSRLLLFGAIGVVLALAAGGVLFVVSGGLGGGRPTPTGSPGASIAVTSPAPSAGASDAPASALPSPVVSAAPTPPPETIPPEPPIGIKIKGAKASSQLSASRAVKYVHDGSPATTWKSGYNKFEGSWIEVSFAPAAVTRIQIWSGWQVDKPFFEGNHRPRNVTVSFNGGDPLPLKLKDTMGAQRVDIPPALGITRATRVRITILDVYPARKTTAPGSPTAQVAVSEIKIFGIPVTP